jgi:hypothetical protein
MPVNKNITKLIILITVAALVLAGRFLFIDAPTAVLLITKFGYCAVAMTCAGFVVLLARQLPAMNGIVNLCKRHRTGLICVLLAGAYFQVQEPREFKVLFDEFVISGVARNMHFDREATYSEGAHYFDGRLIVMKSGVDKRPFLFPFVVSLAHDLTGYRPQNVFYVNACMAVVLLLLVYVFGFTCGGTRLGCLGVLLLTGLPLVAQNATGGGYELMNLVMILSLCLLGSIYYRSPGTQGLDLFILAAVLLAQVRYESILYVLVVPAAVACKWCQEKRITLTWMAAISPAMLLMPLAANRVFTSNASFYQTQPGQKFLSVHYFLDNARVAMYYLFNPSFDSTNSVLLSALGLFGAAFFLLLAGQKMKQWFLQRTGDVVLFFVFIVTCVNTFVTLCMFWGHWNDPIISRFSLPLQLLMALLTLRVSREFLKSRPLPKWALVLAGMWIVLFAAPASARHYDTNHCITGREYAWFLGYLADKDPETTLTVAASNLGPILYNMPSISIYTAKQSPWKVKACLDDGIYRNVFVLQRFVMDFKSGKYVETGPQLLGDGFKLEPIAEKRFYWDTISRISRIVDVDIAKVPRPPASKQKETDFDNDHDRIMYLLNKFP